MDGPRPQSFSTFLPVVGEPSDWFHVKYGSVNAVSTSNPTAKARTTNPVLLESLESELTRRDPKAAPEETNDGISEDDIFEDLQAQWLRARKGLITPLTVQRTRGPAPKGTVPSAPSPWTLASLQRSEAEARSGIETTALRLARDMWNDVRLFTCHLPLHEAEEAANRAWLLHQEEQRRHLMIESWPKTTFPTSKKSVERIDRLSAREQRERSTIDVEYIQGLKTLICKEQVMWKGVVEFLALQRSFSAAIMIQKCWRGWLARRKVEMIRRSGVVGRFPIPPHPIIRMKAKPSTFVLNRPRSEPIVPLPAAARGSAKSLLVGYPHTNPNHSVAIPHPPDANEKTKNVRAKRFGESAVRPATVQPALNSGTSGPIEILPPWVREGRKQLPLNELQKRRSIVSEWRMGLLALVCTEESAVRSLMERQNAFHRWRMLKSIQKFSEIEEFCCHEAIQRKQIRQEFFRSFLDLRSAHYEDLRWIAQLEERRRRRSLEETYLPSLRLVVMKWETMLREHLSTAEGWNMWKIFCEMQEYDLRLLIEDYEEVLRAQLVRKCRSVTTAEAINEQESWNRQLIIKQSVVPHALWESWGSRLGRLVAAQYHLQQNETLSRAQIERPCWDGFVQILCEMESSGRAVLSEQWTAILSIIHQSLTNQSKQIATCLELSSVLLPGHETSAMVIFDQELEARRELGAAAFRDRLERDEQSRQRTVAHLASLAARQLVLESHRLEDKIVLDASQLEWLINYEHTTRIKLEQDALASLVSLYDALMSLQMQLNRSDWDHRFVLLGSQESEGRSRILTDELWSRPKWSVPMKMLAGFGPVSFKSPERREIFDMSRSFNASTTLSPNAKISDMRELYPAPPMPMTFDSDSSSSGNGIPNKPIISSGSRFADPSHNQWLSTLLHEEYQRRHGLYLDYSTRLHAIVLNVAESYGMKIRRFIVDEEEKQRLRIEAQFFVDRQTLVLRELKDSPRLAPAKNGVRIKTPSSGGSPITTSVSQPPPPQGVIFDVLSTAAAMASPPPVPTTLDSPLSFQSGSPASTRPLSNTESFVRTHQAAIAIQCFVRNRLARKEKNRRLAKRGQSLLAQEAIQYRNWVASDPDAAQGESFASSVMPTSSSSSSMFRHMRSTGSASPMS